MDELRLETKLGTLVANINDDPLFPNITIHLYRNGKVSGHSVSLEVAQDEPCPCLSIIAWDSWDGEPIVLEHFTSEEIDKELS